jgi:hypothetical protein
MATSKNGENVIGAAKNYKSNCFCQRIDGETSYPPILIYDNMEFLESLMINPIFVQWVLEQLYQQIRRD